MIVDVDLHLHPTCHQNNDLLRTLALNALQKGLDIVGYGDTLIDDWIKEIKRCQKIDEGTFEFQGVRFILAGEVETSDGVHHLLIFPSYSTLEEFKSSTPCLPYNSENSGKIKVDLSPSELVDKAVDLDIMVGPTHIFNPWRGLYGCYHSIEECYGDASSKISFIELGLNANTDYADRIQELHRLTFLTNSDAHNPHPVRLGREFTRFKVEEATFEGLRKALLRRGVNRSILNVGLPPEEGKYNQSACCYCHKQYSPREAEMLKWRCRCGKPIKKGVTYLVEERATFITPQHPIHRPPYLPFLPLAEIITKVFNKRSPFSDSVQRMWRKLVSKFGDEIQILLDTPIEELVKTASPAIVEAIEAFREADVIFKPGGGGEYGEIIIPVGEETLRFSLKPEEKRIYFNTK